MNKQWSMFVKGGEGTACDYVQFLWDGERGKQIDYDPMGTQQAWHAISGTDTYDGFVKWALRCIEDLMENGYEFILPPGCPECGSIMNAKAAGCMGMYHADNQIRESRERRQAIQLQAAEIATKASRIRELERQLEELQEDERCDCAPNLALAACKKKLEQLEGMLEGQRRNTRELGANLQRVRDEKAAMKEDLRHKQRELDTANELSRQHQTQRDQQFQRAQEMQKRKDRALSLVRRAAAILDPPTVTETWDGDTRITSSWDSETGMQGVTVTPQAKKTEPRPANAWRCAAMKDGHSCDQTHHHALGDGHHCHCGQWWGSK